MEHHRTRPPQNAPRGRTPPPVRPVPPVRAQVLPNPRLTGLGAGVFCGALALLLGWVDELLAGGSSTVYGVLFLPVCLLTALWVRGPELVAAPVVVPIAFTLGLLPKTDGGDGSGARLMSLFTALGTHVAWLYAATLAAGVVALIRGLGRLAHRRRVELRRR
ncbi:DUF6542 domain-containing protein [Streptomyces sp. NPDC002328]|uniref:DUF6542 domain-containing protein n=1 Tax=Streptomyces sp. NPDC002328 TaxID=3364642 RepID=UPI0036B269E6